MRVHVETGERVAIALMEALPHHARRRGVVLAVVGRGPAPPWCPGARLLSDVADALTAAGVPASWSSFGRAPAAPGGLARLPAAGGDRRALEISYDAGLRCRLPRGWIGRHLLMVLPAVADRTLGPLAAALAGLARATATGGSTSAELDERVGAQIVAESFAGFTWIVDAHRVLVRARRPGARAHARSIGRAFVHGATGCTAAEIAARAEVLDAWLSMRMHARAADEPSLTLVGRAAHDPWPAARAEPVTAFGPLWPQRGREVRRP